MSRLLLVLLAVAIVVLVGAFVPVNGRTLVERWNGTPAARQAVQPAQAVKAPPKAFPGRSGSRTSRARPEASPEGPEEHHTDADRNAIDRIVNEHSADPQAPRR